MSLPRDVCRMLLSHPEVTSLVRNDVKGEWIFAHAPQAEISSTGESMIVVRQIGPWAVPNRHNTMKFPRIRLEVWSDPSRDADGNISAKDAEERALALSAVCDNFLHLTAGPEATWGSTRVLTSYRLDEPVPISIPVTDGAVMAVSSYAVTLG
jgi:hypothetical protein